jgi:hypothetical protein
MSVPSAPLRELLSKIRTDGRLSAEERETVLDYWSRAYFAMRRPPFFKKDFSHCPSKVAWTAWLMVRASGRGYRLFENLFSPSARANYDLVVKQGGLVRHARQYIESLRPEALITIVRHPCAVIASVRRGRKLKLMASKNRVKWLDGHLPMCEDLGYSAARVEEMSEVEFDALGWLLENNAYLLLSGERPNSHVIDYGDLCREARSVTQTLFEALDWQVTGQTERFLVDTCAPRKRAPLVSKLTAGHSYFSVYRPAKDSVNSWKQELSQQEQNEITAVARPLIERFWPDQNG